MNGQYEDKLPQARAMYLYVMLHPRKKLTFMGNETGQLREWNVKQEQDWMLRKYPIHDAFYHYMSELNNLYLSYPAFYKADYETDGFEWLDCHQEQRCIYSIERRAGKVRIIGIFNFSNQKQTDYSLKIPNVYKLSVLLNTDWERFGGNTSETEKVYAFEEETFTFDLMPFSGILLKV